MTSVKFGTLIRHEIWLSSYDFCEIRCHEFHAFTTAVNEISRFSFYLSRPTCVRFIQEMFFDAETAILHLRVSVPFL